MFTNSFLTLSSIKFLSGCETTQPEKSEMQKSLKNDNWYVPIYCL